MKKLKFKIISYNEIMDVISNDSMPDGWLTEYIQARPDIFENVDIFCENCRTGDQQYKNFDLFERSEDPDIYVFCLYLELFEFANKPHHISKCIKHYSEKYPDKKIIFHWNHDNDWSRYGKEFEQYENVYITNFGYSSEEFKNNIRLPFWVINTIHHEEPKQIFAGFIGNPNNELRQQLAISIQQANANGNKDFLYAQVPYDQYLKTLSSCIFSLCPRGGGGSGGFSYRFFECFHLNTIPVLFADSLIFPYDDIDYNDISIRIPEVYINDINEIENILKSKDVDKMLKNINIIKKRFSLKGVQEEVYKELI